MRVWLRRMALGVVASGTFAAATAFGALFHLDLPLARRAASDGTALALAGLPGKSSVRIGRISRSVDGIQVHDVDGDFADPEGRPALSVRSATAAIAPIALVTDRIATGRWTLRLTDVRAGSVDVALDDDGKKLPRVARAFAPETPKPASSEPESPTSFVLLVDGATVDHAFVHGRLGGTTFDADANAVRGRVAVADDVTVLVDDAELLARGLPREARARVRGRVGVREDHPVELAADAVGAFGDAFLHARATGDLVRLDAVAAGVARGGDLAARGSLWLPDPTAPMRARAWARTKEVPLRALDETAPAGDVTVEALAGATFGDELAATGKARSAPTTIAGQHVPAIDARADGHGRTWHADATATDPGLWAKVTATLEGDALHAEAEARADDVGSTTVLPPLPLHGATHATAKLDGDVAKRSFTATATGDVQRLAVGPVHAAYATLGANVRFANDAGVGSATAVLRQGDARVDALARAVRFSTARGLEALSLEARTATGRARVELQPSRIDGAVDALAVQELTPFLDAKLPVTRATLTGSFALGRGARSDAEVHVRADDVDGAVGEQSFEGAKLVVDGRRSGAELTLDARAELVNEASVVVHTERLRIPALAFDRASLLAIVGRVDVDADVTFACLRTWFGDAVPSSEGRVSATLAYLHEAARDPHLVGFDVATHGAAMVVPALGSLEGIDGRAGGLVSLDDAHADLAVAATDRIGTLVNARLATAFDAPVWSGAILDLERWKRTPLALHLDVPERDVRTLPSKLRPTSVGGRVAASVDAHGTFLDPAATFAIDDRGATSGNVGEAPVDLHVDGTFDRSGLAATVGTTTDRALASRLDGTVRVELPWSAVLEGRAADAWVASGSVTTQGLALGAIGGWFTRTPIKGTASGFVRVDGLHRDARAGVALRLDGVAVGKRPVGTGTVAALLDGRRAAVNVDLAQEGGRLDVAAGGVARWGSELVPTLDFVTGIDGSVRAKSFDVSFVRPFVRKLVPGFAGRLDAGLGFHVGNDLTKSNAVGTVTLSGGRAQIAALGDEVRDVRVKLDLARDGTRTAVKISDVEIYPATGRINASGEATLEGLDPRQAKLHLHVPKGYEVPVGMEGLPVGELNGDIDVALARSTDGRLNLAVNVPATHLTLAPVLGRDVQELDADPHVHVGKRAVDGTFTELGTTKAKPEASSPIPIHVDVALGDDVWIERQSDVEARVTGRIAVDLDSSLRLGGSVSAPEGWVEIQGRRFRVERARVDFDGQPPSDPVIQATARYDASGGIKIFADYVGTVKNGRVFLRAEPSLTPNEIVSTLVFGSPNAQVGSSRSASASPALQAAAFAGGYVTQGLNKALDDVSPLAVTTRVDTTSSTNPRPELSVRIVKNVSLTVGVNLGVPSPGQPPDRTTFQLEYQFLPQWKVRTTGGDKGTAILDFIWQYRY